MRGDAVSHELSGGQACALDRAAHSASSDPAASTVPSASTVPVDPRRTTAAPPPPVSGRQDPRFTTPERKAELAGAFLGQGAEYDHLRPGYPRGALERICEFASSEPAARRGLVAVDLGAGTGKLSLALAEQGLTVHAVDPSAAMLDVASRQASRLASRASSSFEARSSKPGNLVPHVGSAESTGLPAGCAQIVTAAQAWHWFDPEKATAEVLRLLGAGQPSAFPTPSPGTQALLTPDAGTPAGLGLLALVWNTLDVQVPWVHRYSRIAHAGDVQRDGFTPTTGPGLELVHRETFRWVDERSTQVFVDLAKTRSYYVTAPPHRQERVIDNLNWYLHEHLGHEPGTIIAMPYRTDLFLYRPAR